MDGLRWTGSDRVVMDTEEADGLASAVVYEIVQDQYDGYKCMNEYLARQIAWRLLIATQSITWHVRASWKVSTKEYLVWVER